MAIRQYAPKEGFTQKQIERGDHTVYQDWECPRCKFVQSVANLSANNSSCYRCGLRYKESSDEGN